MTTAQHADAEGVDRPGAVALRQMGPGRPLRSGSSHGRSGRSGGKRQPGKRW